MSFPSWPPKPVDQSKGLPVDTLRCSSWQTPYWFVMFDVHFTGLGSFPSSVCRLITHQHLNVSFQLLCWVTFVVFLCSFIMIHPQPSHFHRVKMTQIPAQAAQYIWLWDGFVQGSTLVCFIKSYRALIFISYVFEEQFRRLWIHRISFRTASALF